MKAKIGVIGLGIVGLSISHRLAAAGYQVFGFEQFERDHSNGSSHGDTRIFRKVPFEGPEYMKLADKALNGWKTWEKKSGKNLLVQCGGLDMGMRGNDLLQASLKLCQDHKQQHTVLTGKEVNQRFEIFNVPEEWQAVFQPESGYVRPDETMEFLRRDAVEMGAKLLWKTGVTAIEKGPESITLRTGNGVQQVDYVVVAAGPWVGALLPELKIPTEIIRNVLGWFEMPELPANTPIFIDGESGYYGMPTPSGLIKIAKHNHLNEAVDVQGVISGPQDADAQVLASGMEKYFKAFTKAPKAMKRCLYTNTPDHDFMMDYHPEDARVMVFSPCSGHGMKYAPTYGDIALEMLEGQRPASLFRLDRFKED